MALQLGLADFQLVHPTEMETFTSKQNTGELDAMNRPIIAEVSQQRRKRVAVKGGRVVVKNIRAVSRKEPVELTFNLDPSGRAISAVTGDLLPQIPMECDYEVYGPDGSVINRGKVRCGGNEQVNLTEVASPRGMNYDFSFEFEGRFEPFDEFANALYECGCDDCTLSQSGGVTRIDFSRDGPNLKECMNSAQEQMFKAIDMVTCPYKPRKTRENR